MGQYTTGNGVAPSATTKPQSASALPSASSTQKGSDFDFSSLTQGMFSKPWVYSKGVGAGKLEIYNKKVGFFFWKFFPVCWDCKLLVQEACRVLFCPFCVAPLYQNRLQGLISWVYFFLKCFLHALGVSFISSIEYEHEQKSEFIFLDCCVCCI